MSTLDAHWEGRMVGVFGTGVVGRAVADHLLSRRVGVRFFDDNDVETSRSLEELLARGAQICDRESDVDVALADLVALVPSPGVPPTHTLLVNARHRQLSIVGDLDIAMGAVGDRPIVAITGTNGKTTVTQLIESVLIAGDRRAVACGNYGTPLIEAASDPLTEIFVVEVSSFQLHYAQAFAPRVAVITNIADDHLDWHGSATDYANAKARITQHLGEQDLLVADIGDPVVRSIVEKVPSNVFGYSVGSAGSVVLECRGRTPEFSVEMLGVLSTHNRIDARNTSAALATAMHFGVAPELALQVAERTPRFHHRLERIGEAGGVQFIDDSKATNPHATLAALEGRESVILLAGGKNKGLDLSVLGNASAGLKHVVGIGDAATEIAAAFLGRVPVETHQSMAAAVAAAVAASSPGDTVLLSPACASFDWYSSYAERGDDFANNVRALPGFRP